MKQSIDSLNAEAMADVALGRTGMYDLLVSVFSHLPDEDLISAIKGRDLFDILDTSCSAEDTQFQTGRNLVKTYQSSIKQKTNTEVIHELSVDRTRIIRATGRTDLKPPYEGLYLGRKSGGASVLAVHNFYRKAGIVPDERTPEPPDFLCVELDFMSQLCRREHAFWSSASDVTETVSFEERFLREHLGKWVGAFCDQAEKKSQTRFYRGFLNILNGFIDVDMGYLSELVSD
jgi:TorA maturation chaperone TorD